MSRRLACALGVLGSLLLFRLVPGAAHACSVCLPGDPVFSTHGASSQEAGSFSIYLETRGFRKTSGALPHGEAEDPSAEAPHDDGHEVHHHEESNDHDEHAADAHEDGEERFRGQRLDLFASWTPLDRWTLTLDVPFAWNRIVEEEGGERTRSTLGGLGDVSLGSSFVLWRNREVLPSTWLEGRIWLKAPSGRDAREKRFGDGEGRRARAGREGGCDAEQRGAETRGGRPAVRVAAPARARRAELARLLPARRDGRGCVGVGGVDGAAGVDGARLLVLQRRRARKRRDREVERRERDRRQRLHSVTWIERR